MKTKKRHPRTLDEREVAQVVGGGVSTSPTIDWSGPGIDWSGPGVISSSALKPLTP